MMLKIQRIDAAVSSEYVTKTLNKIFAFEKWDYDDKIVFNYTFHTNGKA